MRGALNATPSAVARRFLHRLISQSNRTLTSCDAAEVHDLRVAIRRFSQVLRVFKPCFPAKEVKRVRRALKKTMVLAGQVRDLDIALGFLAESRLRESAAIAIGFQSRRKEAEQLLTDRLQGWAKRRISSRWLRKLLLASAGKGDAETGAVQGAAQESLPGLMKRLHSLGVTAVKTGRLEQLHQLRLEAKKLRYTLELLAPLRESAFGGQLKRLKKLQTILGDIHDAQMVEKMVSKETGARRLCAKLASMQDRHIQEFRSYWNGEFAAATHGVPRKPPLRSESGVETARHTG